MKSMNCDLHFMLTFHSNDKATLLHTFATYHFDDVNVMSADHCTILNFISVSLVRITKIHKDECHKSRFACKVWIMKRLFLVLEPRDFVSGILFFWGTMRREPSWPLTGTPFPRVSRHPTLILRNSIFMPIWIRNCKFWSCMNDFNCHTRVFSWVENLWGVERIILI